MADRPTLRRELIAAFVLVFTGAFLVASTGVLVLLPRLDSPVQTAIYVSVILILDVAIFAVFGHNLITRRVLEPIDKLVAGAESIAGGELDARAPEGETREINRLAQALNNMAERLLTDQRRLAENIRSLNETNQLLTEARNAMVQSEKMASAGRLGAGIAHEVGNPLGAIIGYLGLLKRNADPPRLELVEAAEREAQRIDRIVRGLLDYSRPREAHTHPIDVNKVVQDTIELVSTQGKFKLIELDLDLVDSAPDVIGDQFQLQQVLVNLMVNAADALEEVPEPRVRVRTVARKHRPSPSRLPSRRKDDHPGIDYSHRRRLHAAPRALLGDPGVVGDTVVEIVIADNGPGIPADLVDQIFEPFVTTKEIGKGTGLGLAVCARLIEGMGGIIRADAMPQGGGATFRIVLPAANADSDGRAET
ncbi:MAG TPA: ATP-binding protein [Longimicrobiales bacterium]